MKYRIRKSTAADVPALFEVWRTAVEATHDFVSPDDHAEISKLVLEAYLPSADLDVAVDENDKPLAFMGMTGDDIDSLFVHASARGSGLGRLLAELAFSRAAAIRTEVNEQNVQAVEFWKHMGFRETGRSETDREGKPYPLLLMECSGDSEET
jgi:putative acetyltransferase